MNAEVSGWVFNIQRFSLHDGPGIRTTVFLKGCPLRCQWCHNPEGLIQRPQLRLHLNLCTQCGRCVSACDHGVHAVNGNAHLLQVEHCVCCGKCAGVCPNAALEIVGQRMAVADVMDVVKRDLPFYQQSGGGVTLSGGEPLAQYAFSQSLLRAARDEGIPTAIETAANCPWTQIHELAPLVDLFLVDLKHTDADRHRALTGVGNEVILANIRRLADARLPLRIRIPWIPTLNAEEQFLSGLERFFSAFPTPPPIEFLPYHRLGTSKWLSLGGVASMSEDIPAATADDIAPWAERLRAAGLSVKVG